MEITKNISKLLTGTPQSQYAAIAILIAMIAIILSVLFNENDLSLSERLMLIGSVILFSIPSIILGLFDLTCVAGKTMENSLCWWWGWVIAAIIIIICVIVVFSSISSMLTYNVATTKSTKPVIDEVESNKIAKDLVNKDTTEVVKPKVEMPTESDMTMQKDIQGMNGDMEQIGGMDQDMGGFMGIESFRNKAKKEQFKVKKDKFSNNIEGFQGCEFSGV
tara:strand:+ start:2138 stop:2797 length:660 start_codon:yes stop_codon:yes gene_type:complete